MKVQFLVTVKLPEGTSVIDMTNYIRNEVQSGCGQYHPTDPISNLDKKSITVKAIKGKVQ